MFRPVPNPRAPLAGREGVKRMRRLLQEGIAAVAYIVPNARRVGPASPKGRGAVQTLLEACYGGWESERSTLGREVRVDFA